MTKQKVPTRFPNKIQIFYAYASGHKRTCSTKQKRRKYNNNNTRCACHWPLTNSIQCSIYDSVRTVLTAALIIRRRDVRTNRIRQSLDAEQNQRKNSELKFALKKVRFADVKTQQTTSKWFAFSHREFLVGKIGNLFSVAIFSFAYFASEHGENLLFSSERLEAIKLPQKQSSIVFVWWFKEITERNCHYIRVFRLPRYLIRWRSPHTIQNFARDATHYSQIPASKINKKK